MLPPLVWLNIVSELDSFTRRQLKLVNRLTCSVVKAAMAQQLSLAASDLKETVLLEEGLAGKWRRASQVAWQLLAAVSHHNT